MPYVTLCMATVAGRWPWDYPCSNHCAGCSPDGAWRPRAPLRSLRGPPPGDGTLSRQGDAGNKNHLAQSSIHINGQSQSNIQRRPRGVGARVAALGPMQKWPIALSKFYGPCRVARARHPRYILVSPHQRYSGREKQARRLVLYKRQPLHLQ